MVIEALINEFLVATTATLLRHSNTYKQKSHSREWLNYMILKLKFGGPCWT